MVESVSDSSWVKNNERYNPLRNTEKRSQIDKRSRYAFDNILIGRLQKNKVRDKKGDRVILTEGRREHFAFSHNETEGVEWLKGIDEFRFLGILDIIAMRRFDTSVDREAINFKLSVYGL